MSIFTVSARSVHYRLVVFVLIVASAIGLVAWGSVTMVAGLGAQRPATSALGADPRASAER